MREHDADGTPLCCVLNEKQPCKLQRNNFKWDIFKKREKKKKEKKKKKRKEKSAQVETQIPQAEHRTQTNTNSNEYTLEYL